MKLNSAILVFVCLSLLACKKDDGFPPFVPPPPVTGDTLPAQYGTPFANVPDRRDATIYQVNVRSFSQQGNLAGVTARLDSIRAMGVNVLYLMPVYPVGTVNAINSPYSVKDYTAVNTEFGSMADLRALVDGAHSRNMSVMLDWVANHTAWDHPWITAHKDWYVQTATGNISNPPGYTDVAQLNFNNAAMRREMIRSMKYWVYAANVDGFRFDFADNPPVDFWKQAVDSLRNITSHKLLLMAEGGRTANFSAGFDYNFGFSFFDALKNVYTGNGLATTFDALNTSTYIGSGNGQQVVRYTSNHDVNSSDGTPLELFGGQTGSLSAFVIAAYMKGVPMIYGGQETGTPYRLVFPFTASKIDWTLNPSLKAEYKKIIAFRNSSDAIRRGTVVSYGTADVTAFVREQSGEKVVVIVNVRNSVVSYGVPAALAGTWKNAFTGETVSLGATLSLQPYSCLVLKNG